MTRSTRCKRTQLSLRRSRTGAHFHVRPFLQLSTDVSLLLEEMCMQRLEHGFQLVVGSPYFKASATSVHTGRIDKHPSCNIGSVCSR